MSATATLAPPAPAGRPARAKTAREAALHVWTPARSAAGGHNPWLIAGIVSIATFMEVLDTAIANVSLRHIAGSLAAGVDESTWVLTSYLVANAIILPVSGWIAGIVGRKRFYMLCVALFTASSLLCGLAPSLPWLIVFRVLQGLGGGGMQPTEQSILADTFPPWQRAAAFAVYGITVVCAPALGPTLGGWITDTYSWHWVFLINVPIGIVSLLLSWRYLDEPLALVVERRERLAKGFRVDYIGFALIALGLGCLEVTLSRGERLDWFDSPFVRVFGITAGLALCAALLWEWYHKDPVVDVRLLGGRNFGLLTMMMFFVGFVLYGSTTLLPMLLQGSHGYTAMLSGMALTPGAVATFFMMPLVAKLARHVQLRHMLACGLLFQALALWHFSSFTPDLTFHDAVMGRILQAGGLAFLFLPITTLAYQGIAPNKSSAVSALINVARNIGGSVGIALTNTWLAQRVQYHHSILIENISPYNANFTGAQAALEQRLATFGSTTAAEPQSLAAIYGGLYRQAALLSFNDVFVISAVVCAALFLFTPLLARNKPGAGAVGH